MMSMILVFAAIPEWLFVPIAVVACILILGFAIIMIAGKFYVKVGPDEAIVRTGMGGMNVIIDGGALVYPVVHRFEKMDLTLKSFEIAREGAEGLICKDNIRAGYQDRVFYSCR